MKKFQVVVTIEADSLEDAERILSERISPEEEYDGIDDYLSILSGMIVTVM